MNPTADEQGDIGPRPVRGRVVPVAGWLTEMKSGYYADVEAAKLRSLLARRHVHAGYLGQVLVSDGVLHLSAQMAGGQELKCGQQQQAPP